MSTDQTLTRGQQIMFTAGKRALASGLDLADVRKAMRAEIREATRHLGATVRGMMLAEAATVLELLEAQQRAVTS